MRTFSYVLNSREHLGEGLARVVKVAGVAGVVGVAGVQFRLNFEKEMDTMSQRGTAYHTRHLKRFVTHSTPTKITQGPTRAKTPPMRRKE